MHTTVVIPARYASTRFPGKILADRTGRSLIAHVHERALAATRVDRVIVATDDERIRAAVAAFGGEAVMTRADHPNGTSRIAEVAASIAGDVIVNVQGDEPEIEPALIDAAVAALDDPDAPPVSTVAAPFAPGEDPADPNAVKVVVSAAGHALYFTRALVPHHRDAARGDRPPAVPLKHVGLYAYRHAFLPVYVRLPPTPLERTEQLEQLRVLEHGHRIAVVVTDAAPPKGIDTPADYEAFVARHAGRRAP